MDLLSFDPQSECLPQAWRCFSPFWLDYHAVLWQAQHMDMAMAMGTTRQPPFLNLRLPLQLVELLAVFHLLLELQLHQVCGIGKSGPPIERGYVLCG